MSGPVILERCLWFDYQIKRGRFPNARTLSEHFEISPRTAQRCIDFLRDRMQAPLEYDPAQKGYFYSQPSFQLPFTQVHQNEILALLVAKNLLSQSAGGFISRAIDRFGRRLLTQTEDIGLTAERLDQAFSAQWTAFSPTPAETFRKVVDALLKNRLLTFDYCSPQQPKLSTRRQVEPHHLQHYMGSWVLLGRCRERQDWRKFFLSRISSLKVEKELFSSLPPDVWQKQLEGGFGIFQGGELVSVKLCFSAARAPWISEQHWHPHQIFEDFPDGSLTLSFPVADFREIKMKILQFGADVEVLGPQELRDEVAREIRVMGEIYKKVRWYDAGCQSGGVRVYTVFLIEHEGE
jgi:predicted DNA-binding transcriptional regulator YafY